MTLENLGAVGFALYASHMVADHLLQTDWQAANKSLRTAALKRKDYPSDVEHRLAVETTRLIAVRAMAGHLCSYFIAQWTFLCVLVLLGAPLSSLGLIVGLVVSVGTHGLIDRRWPVTRFLEATGSAAFAKLGTLNGQPVGIGGMYLADQALHIFFLFVSAILITVL